MKNFNKNKTERVEVMALFGYEMTPCQPLTFKRPGDSEVEITELVRTRIRFVGQATLHIFDVLVGREAVQLEFNSVDLSWHLTQAAQFTRLAVQEIAPGLRSYFRGIIKI